MWRVTRLLVSTAMSLALAAAFGGVPLALAHHNHWPPNVDDDQDGWPTDFEAHIATTAGRYCVGDFHQGERHFPPDVLDDNGVVNLLDILEEASHFGETGYPVDRYDLDAGDHGNWDASYSVNVPGDILTITRWFGRSC